MKNKNRTIIVDFGDEDKYQTVISSGKFFLEFVLAYVLSLGFQLLHKEHCTGEGNCFTRHSHYVRVKCGGVTIWRIQCKECGAVFTVIPSFLLRYCSQRAEQVKKALIAYHGGLSFENCALCFNISGIALYRFICSLGKNSILDVLHKAGIPLPEHVSGDEKHSECEGEKGYIPVVSSGHCIWDIDYTENADETSLEASYGHFAQETQAIESEYLPSTVNHDGFNSTINAFKKVFGSGVSLLLCWLHACWSLERLLRSRQEITYPFGLPFCSLAASLLNYRTKAMRIRRSLPGNKIAKPTDQVISCRLLKSFSKELAAEASNHLFEILKKCHAKTSLQKISLKNSLIQMLRKYEKILPPERYKALKKWIDKKKSFFYNSMDFPLKLSFSFSIDHICNHLDRKLFMMKHFHHKEADKPSFLRGFALIHNFIPYQRFARNANKSPAEVEGAVLPHSDWFVSLLMLVTAGGYCKKNA